jgi:hypothetical protein
MAGFSWVDSKSAVMICCRGWCDSGMLARVACYICRRQGRRPDNARRKEAA